MSRMGLVPDRELSLKAAAKLRGLKEGNVYKRCSEERIRTHPGRDRRTKHLVYLDQFDQDIAALRCQGPGCSEPVTNAGEYCSLACSVRKYPVERRVCRQCSEEFKLIGHRAKEGDENFCSPSCSAAWHWENEPETFPQSARRGRMVACPCGRTTRYQSPKELHRVVYCPHCAPEFKRHWWTTPEGMVERERAGARSSIRWLDVHAQLEQRKADRGALGVADICAKLGGVSTPTVTRYYTDELGELTSEAERIDGQRFRLYTNPQEVKILQARRATGPAWDTWLDYDWVLQRARETGRIEFLMERGLTEAEAEKMIRREVADARQLCA